MTRGDFMKKIGILLFCLIIGILLTACTKPAEDPLPPSSKEQSGVTESTVPGDIQAALQEKEEQERLKKEKLAKYCAPSEAGYQYHWDDTLQNIYAPSEAYPMGDPQPGGEPIHIEPRVENSSGTDYSFEKPFYGKGFDFLCFGGDIMGYKVACVQAITKEEWESGEFLYSTDKKDYTKENLSAYLIREDEDYVLLDITELVLGSSFEESLKQKAAERNTPEVMYSWVLGPAAHLKEHLSEIIVKG